MERRKGKTRRKVSFLLFSYSLMRQLSRTIRKISSSFSKHPGLNWMKSFQYLIVSITAYLFLFVFLLFSFREEEARAGAPRSSRSSRPAGATGHPWNSRYSRKQRYRGCRTPRTSWATGTTGRSRSSRYKTSRRNKITETRARL